MIYKIGTIADLNSLPLLDDTTLELLYHHASVLTTEYGANRNVDEDDGGFVLFAPPGTSNKDIKAFFDISEHTLEYVNTYGSLCEAVYLTNNDFAVVIVMSIADAPTEIRNEID